MFVEVGAPHHRPHFHAYYQNDVGIFSLQSVELIAGELPKRQLRLNFQPVLGREIYAPLRELSVFNQVRIDSEVHTLVWPNGADFDPETLHDWPRYADAFAKRAQSWNTRAA
jgi:hypothetical protein